MLLRVSVAVRNDARFRTRALVHDIESSIGATHASLARELANIFEFVVQATVEAASREPANDAWVAVLERFESMGCSLRPGSVEIGAGDRVGSAPAGDRRGVSPSGDGRATPHRRLRRRLGVVEEGSSTSPSTPGCRFTRRYADAPLASFARVARSAAPPPVRQPATCDWRAWRSSRPSSNACRP